MKKRHSKYSERTPLISYATYKFYCDKKIPPKYKVNSFKEFKKIAREIFRVASYKLVNNKGGIVLDKLGYIGHWRMPKKKVFKQPKKGGATLNTNNYTNRHFYITQLMTSIYHKNNFKGWSMDKSFNRTHVKMERFKKLKAGLKYKFYYNLIRNIYTNKYIIK